MIGLQRHPQTAPMRVGEFFSYHAVPTNSRALAAFDTMSWPYGNARYGGGARGVERRGTGSPSWLRSGSPSPYPIPLPSVRFAAKHRGRSRMRASRSYGSVGGCSVMSVPTAIGSGLTRMSICSERAPVRLFTHRHRNGLFHRGPSIIAVANATPVSVSWSTAAFRNAG